MWKILALLAFAVAGTGLLWERSIFPPMHSTPNELFGTKKKKNQTQNNKPENPTKTNKHLGWEPLARHSGAGAGSCAATSWWLRGWPQHFTSLSSIKTATNLTDSLHKFELLISAPSEPNYFSGGKKEKIKKAVTEGKYLWSVWISADSVQHLFPLSAFPCVWHRPTVRRIRSSCVHSSHATAKLPGTEVEQELLSFHHCPLMTFLKSSVRNNSLTKKQQNALSQMTFLNFVT